MCTNVKVSGNCFNLASGNDYFLCRSLDAVSGGYTGQVRAVPAVRGTIPRAAPSSVYESESVLILLCGLGFPIPARLGCFRDTLVGYMCA